MLQLLTAVLLLLSRAVSSAAFAAFFALVSVYNRLDFTITRDERWQEQQSQDKARGILQQLADIWDGKCLTRFVCLCCLVIYMLHICQVKLKIWTADVHHVHAIPDEAHLIKHGVLTYCMSVVTTCR